MRRAFETSPLEDYKRHSTHTDSVSHSRHTTSQHTQNTQHTHTQYTHTQRTHIQHTHTPHTTHCTRTPHTTRLVGMVLTSLGPIHETIKTRSPNRCQYESSNCMTRSLQNRNSSILGDRILNFNRESRTCRKSLLPTNRQSQKRKNMGRIDWQKHLLVP